MTVPERPTERPTDVGLAGFFTANPDGSYRKALGVEQSQPEAFGPPRQFMGIDNREWAVEEVHYTRADGEALPVLLFRLLSNRYFRIADVPDGDWRELDDETLHRLLTAGSVVIES